MKEYKQKDLTIKAVRYDGTNGNEIASAFAGFDTSSGSLKDRNGTMVSAGQWVVEFEGGFSKIMTDILFQHLFDEVLPPKFKLADIEHIEDRKIKRASWNDGCYIYCFKSVFFLHDGENEEYPYHMSIADLQADDWMVL